MFDTEMEYFLDHQEELVEKYGGRILVLRGTSVQGDFPSLLEAYLFAKERFDAGTYMIQPCVPGRDAYTVSVSASAAIWEDTEV